MGTFCLWAAAVPQTPEVSGWDGCGAAPGAEWESGGTMFTDICSCHQAPVVHSAPAFGSNPVPLPWNSLCCLGWIGCHMRGVEQSWAGRKFSFQVIYLSPEILSAVLEVLSSSLMNDAVFALSCEAGIWACWDTDFPVIHVTQMLALVLHPFLKGEEVGKDWVRLGCSWTLSLWVSGCSLLNSCLLWAGKWRDKKKN